jgi:hypothetical protein
VANASGHLDDARWNDDDLFDRGLDAILATAQPDHNMQRRNAAPSRRGPHVGCR